MAGSLPKYLQVRQTILSKIKSGELKVGDKLPVREDLLKEFKVTRTTLDRALKGLTDNGILHSSKRGGTVVAQNQLEKKNIGIVSRLSSEAIYRHQGVGNDLEQMFATMILASQNRANISFLDEEQILHSLKSITHYDGLIWVQPDESTMNKLKPFKASVIVTNRNPVDLNFVSTNHRAAISELTEHFINSSSTDAQLFFLHSDAVSIPYFERREGFIQSCKKHKRFYQTIELSGDYQSHLKTLHALDIDKNKPLIVVSMGRQYSSVTLAFAKTLGYELGQNFHYSDFDNYNALSEYGVNIPTILQDYGKMGQIAIERILDIENNSVQEYIPYIVKGI